MSINTPYQFIGYWGKFTETESEKFDLILKKLIHSKNCKIKPHQSGKTLYLNLNEIFLINSENQEVIAALSAGGLLNKYDVWVKVENNCLILGREAMGRVPLYWTQVNETIWFASQFKLLLSILKNPEINLIALSAYTSFSYVPTPLTPVDGIWSIPPGVEQTWRLTSSGNFHYVEKLPEKILHSWQSLPKLVQDEKTTISQLKNLLKITIEEELETVKDEPVGVFLSGGLDSSIVAALLVQAGVKVRAYSLDFGIDDVSELTYAEQVASFLKITLVKVPATPKHIKKALTATGKALDLPFGDGVTVPLYLLGQVASQETAIIFNGEHGDQLFAGWTNKPLIAASLYQRKESFSQQYLGTFHRLYGYENKVFYPSLYSAIKFHNQEKWLTYALDERFTTCFLDRLRRANLMLKGSQNIQPRATSLAFAHGLWVRSPFCNLSLAEWTFQIPGEFFLRGSCEKYILKKAVDSWLPSEIVWREKRGMGVPLTQWCLSELWSTVGYWLNPNQLQQEQRFTPDIGMKIILGKLGGQIRGRRIGEILWLLLMWEVWRSQVFGEKVLEKSGYNPFWMPYWGWKLLSSLESRD